MDENINMQAQVESQEPEEEEVDDRPILGKCHVCGKEIREGDEYESDDEDNLYCLDCEDERVCCEHCNRYFPPDTNETQVRVGRHDYEYWCDDCVSEDAETCDDCGEIVDRDYTQSDDHRYVCEACYDDNWVRCDECGDLVRTDWAFFDDRRDEYFCEYCWDNRNHSENICDYGYKPIPHFFGDAKESDGLFMGFELEAGCLDSSCDADDIAGEVSDAAFDRCYCKEDGSIDDYGFELVTHPHTLAAHKEAGWDKVLKIMRDGGMLSHDAQNCGLHVHVSRNFMGDGEEQGDRWDRVADFMSEHKEKFVKLARRHSSYAYYACDGQGRRGRYCALNLTNSQTAEFRIFKGTLKYTTVLASLELVDATCRFIKQWSRPDIVPGWFDFNCYINDHRGIYQELTDYMDAKGVWLFARHKPAEEYVAADEC